MARSTDKKKKKKKSRIKRAPEEKARAVPEQPQLHPGLPAENSIEEVLDFVSPQHVHYKILRTNEMDAYDPVPEPRKKRASTKQRS